MVALPMNYSAIPKSWRWLPLPIRNRVAAANSWRSQRTTLRRGVASAHRSVARHVDRNGEPLARVPSWPNDACQPNRVPASQGLRRDLCNATARRSSPAVVDSTFMSTEYAIETSKPSLSQCECCGGLTTRLTRFVYRGGDAFAVYYAIYSNSHRENEVDMLVSLGEWGEGSDPSQRAAFYCRVRPSENSYDVKLVDAAESPWSTVAIMGQELSRAEALSHPWKQTAFEILDEAFLRDCSLRGFLHRVACGDPAVPLEHSFGMPDDVFALGDERSERAEVRRNFASLDGKRFFVRCLLPVPVEDYGTWSIGLWVEVSKDNYDRVWSAWDTPEDWVRLQFSGSVANDGAELGLPIISGTTVHVHAPDPSTPLHVESVSSSELSTFLSKTWTKASFESYAVIRGFL